MVADTELKASERLGVRFPTAYKINIIRKELWKNKSM